MNPQPRKANELGAVRAEGLPLPSRLHVPVLPQMVNSPEERQAVNIDELIAELAASIPELPGCRCKGRHDIWESDDPALVEFAINQCRTCSALHNCSSYIDSLKPSQRPLGVCAGKLRRERQSRKAAA
jgi:WhiB family redox-sensing transcriptional regulator